MGQSILTLLPNILILSAKKQTRKTKNHFKKKKFGRARIGLRGEGDGEAGGRGGFYCG